jgi:hypothetical protein
MDETPEKPVRMQPPQHSRAVVDRLIRSYWAGALHSSDVKRIMRTSEMALNRLEQAVKDEEVNQQ